MRWWCCVEGANRADATVRCVSDARYTDSEGGEHMHEATPVTVELDMAAPDCARVLGSKFEVELIAPDIIFGEGPIGDKQAKHLSFVDIIGDTIWRWKPGGKAEHIMKPSAKANGMVLDKEGRL